MYHSVRRGPCHSERGEESKKYVPREYLLRFLAPLGMTDREAPGTPGPLQELAPYAGAFRMTEPSTSNLPFLTCRPVMSVRSVSPFLSKLHLPSTPSQSLVAAMASRILARSLALAFLIASSVTRIAS